MIDEIFWTFAIKSVAKRLNIFQIDLNGRTLESMLHGAEVEYISMKSYHMLYYLIYTLDALL